MSDESALPEMGEQLPITDSVLSLGVLEKSDRVTWFIRWVYEQAYERPTESHSTGSFLTSSADVSPYTRTMRPTSPMPFDIGYVENPRYFFIENITRWRGNTRPSIEQQNDIDSTRVRVTVAGIEVASLGPKDPAQVFIGSPSLAVHLMIEPVGDVLVKLTCFPG